jgi:flagellar biosynthesis protein FliQ
VTPDDIALASRHMLLLTLLFVSPFLGAGLVAGILVSLVQAATRMNDMTLHFVPRFVAALLVIALTGSWIGARMIGYFEDQAVQIATVRD